MPRGEIDRIAELEGAMKAKDDQLSSLRGQLAEKETQLDGANDSNTALSREIGGLKANVEFLTAERDGIDKNLEATRRLLLEKTDKVNVLEGHVTALKAHDPEEQARLAREQASAALLEAEEAAQLAATNRLAEEREIDAVRKKRQATESNQVVGEQVRASLIVLAFLLAIFGALYFWWNVELDLWTYIGTLVIVPIVVGLLPQLSDHLERGGKWANEGRRIMAICAIIAGTIGLLVAIFGIKGEGWWMWITRLMVFFGYGGYVFMMCYLIWRMPSVKKKWWGLLPAMVFLMILSFFSALIYHPVSLKMLDGVQGMILSNKYLATPVEHLLNVGLWLMFLVLLSGLVTVSVAPGLEFFRKGLGRLNQRKRQSDRFMLGARVIIFVAACVVASLIVRSLWPADGETGRTALAIAMGLLTFVGFIWLKSLLFWLADEKKPYGGVLAMSIFFVFCTSLITGSVFYEVNSEPDRLLALKTEIGGIQQAYYAAAKPVADRRSSGATDPKVKKAYETCVSDMENSMTETKKALTYKGIVDANDAFLKAGSLMADKLDKSDIELFKTIKVPTKPSTMGLYTSSIGNLFSTSTSLPEGVKEVYTGALVMSIITLFVAEFLVLFVFLAMQWGKGKKGQGPPQHDGYIVSQLYVEVNSSTSVPVPAQVASATAAAPPVVEEEEVGTKFLVTCAQGTKVGDDIEVLGDDGSGMAVLKVTSQPGDVAFICERLVAKGMKPIKQGDLVRVLT